MIVIASGVVGGLSMGGMAMMDFEIVTPKRPLSVSFEMTPEDIEFAIATDGQSLREQAMLALLAKLVEPETTHDVQTHRRLQNDGRIQIAGRG
jgi:hypothetical protein